MTVELRIGITEELEEQLVAELAELGFESFAREAGQLNAWGPPAAWSPSAEVSIRSWLDSRSPASEVLFVEHPDENWNARWEASIEPVIAGPFVVMPSWTEPRAEHAGLVRLLVDPKMSFGTGHHASTRLALDLLSRRVVAGGRVLDVGTGTGVLALGALKLGASQAIGCDIDVWSVPNARECAELNDLADRFDVRLGDLDVVSESGFSLILANIIRSVLIPMLPELVARAAPAGTIVLAGLLSSERQQVLDAADAAGLTLLEEAAEAEWWAASWKV